MLGSRWQSIKYRSCSSECGFDAFKSWRGTEHDGPDKKVDASKSYASTVTDGSDIDLEAHGRSLSSCSDRLSLSSHRLVCGSKAMTVHVVACFHATLVVHVVGNMDGGENLGSPRWTNQVSHTTDFQAFQDTVYTINQL